MKSLYKRTILIFITLVLTSITFYSIGVFEFIRVKEKNQKEVLLLILLIILITTFIIFYIFICKPIKILEDCIKKLNIKKDDNEVIDTNNILDIIDNLNDILANHEEQLLKEHTIEILNQKIHFSELQSQINPHFLYNTLETIRGQAIEDKNYTISNMTEALAKYFRYSISNSNDIVRLKDELKNIINYMEIQKYRFEDKISFNLILDENDDELLNSSIPKLTLQPIVENAIYHGLETKEGMGELTIRIEKTQDRIIIIVTDNGYGMDCNTLNILNRKIRGEEDNSIKNESCRSNGIAMINVNSRLKLLFGKGYGINISSTLLLGTEVEIVIPIRMDNRI